MATPMLKSSDFATDPKSFTLDTDDGYFIRETVAYVKGAPAAHADAVTVIVWFHGFFVENRQNIFTDTKGQEVKLLPNLKDCPIDELIFIAPFLGYVQPAVEFILDKNKQKIPKRDETTNQIIPGQFETRHVGTIAYRDVEGAIGKAADDYLSKVLEGIGNFLASKGQALTGSDGKPRDSFTIKNLILACHSGGGVAMRAFVTGLGNSNTAALKGCWCFDCLYNGDDPDFWFKRNLKFYHHYYGTGKRAKALLKLMGHPKDKEFSAEGSTLNVINNASKNHYRTASEGFPERLKNVKLP